MKRETLSREQLKNVKKDVDSIVVGSENLSAFEVDVRLTISSGSMNVYPSDQSKWTDAVDSSLQWCQFTIGTFGSTRLMGLIAVENYAAVKISDAKQNFLQEIVRGAGSDLSIRSSSRMHSIPDFIVGDKSRKPKVFESDWATFAAAVD